MPKAGTIKMKGGKPADYYEISMRQFTSRSCRLRLPATTVWGYGAVNGAGSKNALLLHNAPSLTIEARWNRPVRVKWINDLMDANGNYLPHLLPVDPTLHWANPPGGDQRDATRDPTFNVATPGRVHRPGADRAPMCTARSAWATRATATPRPGSCPPRTTSLPATPPRAPGTTSSRARRRPSYGAAWGPGFAIFQYPNANRASTIWYHDHALGMTRLNVYAGPAGFYIVRGGRRATRRCSTRRFGTTAVLPGPAPKDGDKFPPNKTYYEIPIAIQDRVVQRRRLAVLSRTREFLRRRSSRTVTSPTATSRRSGTRSSSAT